MRTHEEREGCIKAPSPDAMSATTLTPGPAPPVNAVDAPCGVTHTHSVFHIPSKLYLTRAATHADSVQSASDAQEDEAEAESLSTMVFGPSVDDSEIKDIRAEVSFAAFTARVTEEERVAALLATLRADSRRDTNDLARLELQLQEVRARRELVSGLRKMMISAGDDRGVDALVGWEVPDNSKRVVVVHGKLEGTVAGAEKMVKSDSGVGAGGVAADADDVDEGEEDEEEEWENSDEGEEEEEEEEEEEVSPGIGHSL